MSIGTQIVQRTPHTATPAWDQYRRLFPTLERATYLNTCSLGVMTEHAGIVLFPASDPAAVVRTLADHRIIVDDRPGHVRVPPYFYNTVEEH